MYIFELLKLRYLPQPCFQLHLLLRELFLIVQSFQFLKVHHCNPLKLQHNQQHRFVHKEFRLTEALGRNR